MKKYVWHMAFFWSVFSFSFLPSKVVSASPQLLRIDFEFLTETSQIDNRGLSQQRHSSSQQFITISDGGTGKIFIGEKVPYVTWFRNYLANEGYQIESIDYIDIGTAFSVSAHIAGEFIALKLTPEIRFLKGTSVKSILVAKLSTNIEVRPGQAVVLGQGASTSEFYSYFYRSKGQDKFSIKVIPSFYDIE